MGASNFTNVVLGKDPQSAFRSAVEDAQYEHGHGGYTGTIAEKDGFVLFGEIPGRHLDALDTYYYSYEQWKWKTGRKPASPKGIPASMVPLIAKSFETWDDKWGPAVAFEVKGEAVSKYKARVGRKGTRDRLFVFCGMASC